MTPIVKAYSNDEDIEININTLKDQKINAKDIYVLSHDADHTARIVKNTEVSGIDYNRSDVGEKEPKQGDQLRDKLQILGVSESDAQDYEELMDQGNVLLIVTDQRAANVL
ncbi:MAG: general stress protein [Staphylococcus equorum]|uniref:general stress protein n=1 Tax=Staphylococcus TaxID=1279 RepID=UPI0008537C30|nr:general stress protein [Staphylococcus equorum]MDG0823329.1 general stress protein [Staphylococcus equorum]MDG0836849.1 general stress protein [Staphylococcus equorum]MDK9871441.1 general stress protein [Staphylococcus equorum]MDK9877514.1 general stress protein [Staphylococcus equorum]MDN5828477.1 general stress protein [Staphylococcus equorum]